MNLDDGLALAQVGPVKYHLTIESPGAQQRRIEHFGRIATVGQSNEPSGPPTLALGEAAEIIEMVTDGDDKGEKVRPRLEQANNVREILASIRDDTP